MLIVGLVLAALAALLHVYIFWLESLAWEGPAARRIFGIRSDEEAALTRPLAFNQGFYNLFLAVEVALGIGLRAAGHDTVGATLVLTGVGSMAAAAAVLLLSSREHRRAALSQGTLPALAILALVLGLA